MKVVNEGLLRDRNRDIGGLPVSGLRILGFVLIVLGVLGLVYKGFEYTKAVHKTDIGPFQIRYSDKEYVDVPLWAGLICVVAGAACLVIPRGRGLRA